MRESLWTCDPELLARYCDVDVEILRTICRYETRGNEAIARILGDRLGEFLDEAVSILESI